MTLVQHQWSIIEELGRRWLGYWQREPNGRLLQGRSEGSFPMSRCDEVRWPPADWSSSSQRDLIKARQRDLPEVTCHSIVCSNFKCSYIVPVHPLVRLHSSAEVVLPPGMPQETVEAGREPEDGRALTPRAPSGWKAKRQDVPWRWPPLVSPPDSPASPLQALAVAGLSPLLRRSHSPTLFSRLCSTPPASPTGACVTYD